MADFIDPTDYKNASNYISDISDIQLYINQELQNIYTLGSTIVGQTISPYIQILSRQAYILNSEGYIFFNGGSGTSYTFTSLNQVVRTLQTHVTYRTLNNVDKYLYDNNITVRQDFANISQKIGFTINSMYIDQGI